ncbi:MAG: MFS transporter [Anaerolineae bacterium]
MTTTEIAEARPATSLRWQFAVCFFAFILIGANDGAVGVLLPSLMTYYGVNKAQISVMFLAATIGYLSAALTSGMLVARLGRRVFLMLGTGVFAVGAIILASQPPFVLFLGALLCIGVGVAILDAGLNAYIGGLPDNTAVLNYLHAFYGVGALLGPVIASAILAVGLGWNVTYVVWLAMALAVIVGFSRLMDNSRPPGSHRGSNVLAAALRLSVVWLAAGMLFVYVGTEVGLGTWSYTYLTEERHGIELLSAWSISGYWLGLTVGRVVLGHFSRRLGDRRLIQLCLGGVVVGLLTLWLVPNAIAAALALFVIGFSLGPIFPTVIALISGMVPPRLQPSAVGFVASAASMGAAFFPLVIGNIAERAGVWTLMPYTIFLTLTMLTLWPLLSRHGRYAAEGAE